MNSSHVRNQHYVPRFLLHSFGVGNFIWAYDKKWKKSELRSISNVASENYFYDAVAGKKENSFEYVMQKAETDAAPVIKKLIATRNLLLLSNDDICLIALFTSLQLQRTKSTLLSTQDLNETFIEFVTKGSEGMITAEAFMPSRDLWLSSFYNTPELASILINKRWKLLESDNKFYVSDNPVVKQNTINNNPHRGTLGVNSDGIEIYFPLSPSLVLLLMCERTYYMVDCENLFCVPGVIENINSLQVFYADRFVFSENDNFELAVDMISKGECINYARNMK